jgi:hypothetical protein
VRSRREVGVVRVGHDGLGIVVWKQVIEAGIDDPFAAGARWDRSGAERP